MSLLNHNEHHHLSSNNQKQTMMTTAQDLSGIWSSYDSREEVILGVCAAIIVFLCIVVILAVNLRKVKSNEKESLIDNEVRTDFHTDTVHV